MRFSLAISRAVFSLYPANLADSAPLPVAIYSRINLSCLTVRGLSSGIASAAIGGFFFFPALNFLTPENLGKERDSRREDDPRRPLDDETAPAIFGEGLGVFIGLVFYQVEPQFKARHSPVESF